MTARGTRDASASKKKASGQQGDGGQLVLLSNIDVKIEGSLGCEARAAKLLYGSQEGGSHLTVVLAGKHGMVKILRSIRFTQSTHPWGSVPPAAPQPGHPVLGGQETVQLAEHVGGEVWSQATKPGKAPGVRPVNLRLSYLGVDR